ncbi:hypothetical protein CASFOL_040348 [Castilleja foliolosa]|uniref:ATP-dependent DNA helicase n=1 Tax=Castilleja foliolosa TaxID=1961234 RepID=A0ABD3BFR7_9LAMI
MSMLGYLRMLQTGVIPLLTPPSVSDCITMSAGDRRYTPPAPGTLGGIVRGDDPNATGYDIIIHSKDGPPHRVSKLHPSYIPLQYPLLFPFAEQGWSPNLTMHSNSGGRDRRLTVNMYYSYQIQDRYKAYSLLLRGGRLLQQYLVDAYTCIEQNRLDYINANQNIFRSEFVAGMYDALARGDRNVNDIGKRIFLPSSFTGGPRYMYQHYQDALSICRVHGNPQYFVTFTCNVKWPEISRHMSKVGTEHAQNRPDIIARVFHIKVQEFFKFIRSEKPFGEVAAGILQITEVYYRFPDLFLATIIAAAYYNLPSHYSCTSTRTIHLYTIEFQKRGLPHCHSLIWVTTPYKIHDAASVDRYVTAEIPDPSVQPVLHKVITDYMIHGPCGLARPGSPVCQTTGAQSFSPRALNRLLGLTRMDMHITDDSQSNDTDIAGTSIDPVRPPIDEIKNYVDGRFICPHEASWRILNFPIHARNPAVELLAVYLEDMQNVTFAENLRLEAVIRNPLFGKTTLTEWICSNCRNRDGRTLTYVNYPTKYRWDRKAKCWTPRMYTTRPAIGRLTYVHPSSGELFYLRMLLCHQQGCMSFADIHTVSGTIHVTYYASCEALGLIGDDKEWATAFMEASIWATTSELRALFTHMLLFCELSNQHQVVSDVNLQQHVLVELEALLNSSTPSKSLSDFGLPLPSRHTLASLGNRLLLEETCYDRAAMVEATSHSHALLNNDQRKSGMATEFASWLLKIGDGLIGEADINDPLNTRNITIPPQYLIPSQNRRDLEASYPQECLSQLNFPGIPAHQLTLKVNTPVMLIRNINQSLGLCNGTRLIISQMLPRVIEAQIITGTSIGTRVYIPRIKFVHDNKELPFAFTRRQFPIKPTEDNSINITKNVGFSDFIEEINNRFVYVYGDCVEATAELRHIKYFDSVIQLNCCYRVSNYVCVSPRTYMATVDHAASLLIGLKTKFTPIPSSDIPTAYFNFATYDTLKERIKNFKITYRLYWTCYESGNKVEITLWPDKRHLIGDEVAAGDIVAITSTMVTEHNGVLQLESTFLTTVLLNPDLPQTMEHVNRLMTQPATQEHSPDEKMVTIADLLPTNLASKESLKGCTNLTCRATIIQLHENKGWYYVTCSKCSGKMYPEHQNGQIIFVCRDDDDVTPNFKYSVNAKIMDDTGAIDAVFFNDSMTAMLHTSCDDMITKHGHTDSKKLPHLMTSILRTPWLLHLGQKIDGTVVVNDVTEVTAGESYEAADEAAGTSTLTPTTPTPKKGTSKRREALTPGRLQIEGKQKSSRQLQSPLLSAHTSYFCI